MELFWFEEREEMPKELYTEEGKPFESCKQCRRSLQEPPVGFTLEKVFKRYSNTEKPQVLFEYAVCDDCAGDMRNEFSEESAKNLQDYFTQSLLAREERDDQDLFTRLHTCLIKNHSVDQEQEYAIVARGFGNLMLKSHYPFAIGLTAMDELAELLSDKTRDLLDDFVERNFTGPPEFEGVPPDGKWVLV